MLSPPQPSTTLPYILTYLLTYLLTYSCTHSPAAAEQAGFVNVVVDTSDSLFAFDLDEGSATTADSSGSPADTSEGGASTADGSGTTADACPRTAGTDAPACPQGAEEETARRARNQVHVGSRG